MQGRKDCLVHLDDDVEYTSPDGVFMKGMLIPKKGTEVHQHAHEYDHTSVLVKGSVYVYQGDDTLGLTYKAPAFIHVPAKVLHKFEALEDDTHIYCIHNVSNSDMQVKIHKHNNGGL